MIRVHNIYVSHSWSVADTYDKLVRVLQSDPSFAFRLFGLAKNDPVHATGVSYELRAAMRHPMSQCHVLVVQTGVYAQFGKWINEELELACATFELRRRVLAIDTFGPDPKPTPVQERADRVIGWTKSGIITAVRELAAAPPERTPVHADRPEAAAGRPAPRLAQPIRTAGGFGQRSAPPSPVLPSRTSFGRAAPRAPGGA